jgi:hypothetical protein
MGTQLTLEIPDEVLRRAATVASATRRDVASVLQEALTVAFGPLSSPEVPPPPIDDLPNTQLLALCDARLPDHSAARLTELLDKRRAGTRGPSEDAELAALVQAYQSLWLRQSAALAEAVRRGIRPPLEP